MTKCQNGMAAKLNDSTNVAKTEHNIQTMIGPYKKWAAAQRRGSGPRGTGSAGTGKDAEAAALAGGRRERNPGGGQPRVRSHCRFRNTGTDSITESGIK